MKGVLLGRDVYLDSSILIYALEAPSIFPQLRTELIEPLIEGKLRAVTSWITLAEVLAKPLSLRDKHLEAAYLNFLVPSAHLSIYSVNADISREAAAIRSQSNLKLPDTLHLATGKLAGCTCFLTGDKQWSSSGLEIIDPNDLES